MNRISVRFAIGLACLITALWPSTSAVAEPPVADSAGRKWSLEELDFFEKRIRPVLAERCYSCHSAKAKIVQANLKLDTAAGMKAGGDSGPMIVADGEPAASLLLQAIRWESFEMPPDGKLTDAVIADFTRWLEMGAPDPRTDEAKEMVVEPTADHWAFQPPAAHAPPEVKDATWPASAIDRFVLAAMEQQGLTPSPPADPRALLRRVHYDLTGLPPTAEQLAAFERDHSDEAYHDVVERLLASPQFGERWARYWLDVARYADTKGYVFQEDRNYPKAYTYRDWVINAFNDDLPYDRFIIAQIAADQIGDASAAPAAGFLTLGRRFINNVQDIIDDRIDVVSRGLLGLSVSCARCHDHKYDPIPAADYYSLYGVFASSHEPKEPDAPLLLADADRPTQPVVFVRGNPANRGPQVPRQFLAVLAGPERKPFERGSGRLELAAAIASETNPLTARVWANRIWGYLFGQGLVTTPSDLGTRSDPPSHPELLDDLACRLMSEGWSTKKLIRAIVESRTYRQASDDRQAGRTVDPENRLLWRANRRRLDLESLRDSLLAAAGRLDRTVGGPSVQITDPPFATRRSVYGFIDRQNLPGFFRTFDFASPDAHTPRRPLTTVPQQALYLMNSPFVIEQAVHLATRPDVQQSADDPQRVAALFRAALGREPSDDEAVAALTYVTSVAQPDRETISEDDDAWRYGYGQFDESAGRLADFTPLPHFTGSAWQGGPSLPDPALGWALLNAQGGHPGNAPAHAAVRRWIAPCDGRITIDGRLEHSTDKGDGVRARVVAARTGEAGQWTVRNSKTATRVESLAVTAGETVDLVTDCRTEPSFDGFRWTVTVRIERSEPGGRSQWDSAADFRGPRPEPLATWERLAQILLMSNEFAYVD
jgi:hypothetical protein